jgi:hypothetical protein
MKRIDYKSCLAVVKMPSVFMESLLTKGTPLTTAVHGVRDIKILDSTYIQDEDLFIFLIYSKDIPAYVAYHRVEGTLITVDIDYNGKYQVPQLVLEYVAHLITSNDQPVEGE